MCILMYFVSVLCYSSMRSQLGIVLGSVLMLCSYCILFYDDFTDLMSWFYQSVHSIYSFTLAADALDSSQIPLCAHVEF